jgi:hypothetical protein
MDETQRPDLPVSEQINSRTTGTRLDGVVHGDCGHEPQYSKIAGQQDLFVGGLEGAQQAAPLPPNNYTIGLQLTFSEEDRPGASCEITYEDGQPTKIVMSSDEHGGQQLQDDVFSIGFFTFVSAVARMGTGQGNLQGPMANLGGFNPYQAQFAQGAVMGRRQATFGPGGQGF